MTSVAGTFTLALDPTTHFGFSEDGSHADYELALSPRSEDIRAMMGSNDFPYDLNTAGVMNQKQNMTKAQSLTGFEQCASAFPANPHGDAEIYNSPYHIETTIPWETDCMMYTSLPQRMVRYTSPLGSCGGDQSTSDSSMSEYSWNSPKLYPSVNDVFDSPITEKCQFLDGIDNALSRSLSGRSLEASVLSHLKMYNIIRILSLPKALLLKTSCCLTNRPDLSLPSCHNPFHYKTWTHVSGKMRLSSGIIYKLGTTK